MDPTAFLALVERCLPGNDPKPLAAIVREASGYEPLAIRFDDGPGGPMKLIGSSRPEAVQLASELVIAGHRVRVGLAGLDTRDFDRLGITVSAAFEPCPHLRAAARLLQEAPDRLKAAPVAGAGPRQPPRPPGSGRPSRPHDQGGPARLWDVYGQGRASTFLVYGAPR